MICEKNLAIFGTETKQYNFFFFFNFIPLNANVHSKIDLVKIKFIENHVV